MGENKGFRSMSKKNNKKIIQMLFGSTHLTVKNLFSQQILSLRQTCTLTSFDTKTIHTKASYLRG